MSQVFNIAIWQPIEDLLNNAKLKYHAVLLYSPEFVDLDFNPEGVYEGFFTDGDGGKFLAAVWNNEQDCYDTLKVEPTHYMLKIKGPTE